MYFNTLRQINNCSLACLNFIRTSNNSLGGSVAIEPMITDDGAPAAAGTDIADDNANADGNADADRVDFVTFVVLGPNERTLFSPIPP